MLRNVSDLLACPVCGRGFTLRPPALRCASGHSFDIARQGYVNLLPGGARPGTADTAEMVAARQAFLAAGHYAPLAGAIAGLAAATVPAGPRPCVLDAGSGPGYYLAAVLDRLAAEDIPGPARPGHGHLRPGAAPGRAGPSRDRRGRLGHLAAIPGAGRRDVPGPRRLRAAQRRGVPPGAAGRRRADRRHAGPAAPGRADRAGLLAVDERKDERLAASLGTHFTLARDQELSLGLRLTRAEAGTLAGMGPSARHAGPPGGGRLAAAGEPIAVTAAFRIACYRPAEAHSPGPENGVNTARPGDGDKDFPLR